MTKFEQFQNLAEQRDAIETTQAFLAEQLVKINARLDLLGAELTAGLDLGETGELTVEDEIAPGLDREEEQYPYMADLQVA